ncbi:MAG: RNA methyltransferase [Bacteroidota bacterium]|nr:RNA methyltransferase [Bacteroidota bacterium]
MSADKKELIEYLKQFVSETRLQRFDGVIAERTRHITVVLEDVYQEHNASAVLRSCESFGIQDVHFIENRNKYRISTDVDMGASLWLDIHRVSKEVNNTVKCLTDLKAKGYKIVATTPHEKDVNLSDLKVDDKIALVFGTEIDGITDDVRACADEFVKIPMYGFTESFNISVSAALCMYELTTKLRASDIDYKLSEEEMLDIRLKWLKNSIKRCDLIIEDFYKKKSS